MPKKPPAQPSLINQVEKLFQIAAIASTATPKLKSTIAVDKLFELRVLGRLLRIFKDASVGATVTHVPPLSSKGAQMVVAGNPASADRQKFSHFALSNGNREKFEAWISVETRTLSWSLNKVFPVPAAAFHELDVAIFRSPIGKFPLHTDVCVAASCKNVAKAQKESVREVLGMRRETALLAVGGSNSRAPWLVPTVPTNPASPIFLVSSDPGVRKYRYPVDRHGVYVRYLRFFA